MIDKVKKISYKSILLILSVLVIYVCYCSIFNIYGAQEELSPIVIIIGTIITILFLIQIKKIISKLKPKYINIIAVIICIIFFILMSILGNIFSENPSTDLSNIIAEATKMLDNGGHFESEGYFARYTNQTPIAIFVFLIYKLGNIIGLSQELLKPFAIVINSLFIAISAYFTYLSVKKMKDEKAGLLTLLFFVMNPIFYIYSSYFYTDTICMIFATISIYLYICAIKQEEIKKKILFLVLSGFILALGFEIRVVLAIILIAFILNEILTKRETVKNQIAEKIIIVSCLIISFLIRNSWI